MSVGKLCLLQIALLGLNSCASSVIQVESSPDGAEVSVVTADRSVSRLGKTPLTITSTTFPQLNQGPMQITLQKNGFRSESFLVPGTLMPSASRIVAEMRPDEVSKSCQESVQSLGETSDAVAQAQRLIFNKNYSDAEQLLVIQTLKYPSVATLHKLLGNTYYLQKNLEKALQSYQKADQLAPGQPDIQRMIDKLSTIRGSAERLPAQEAR